jgi:hypothetical protein
MIKNFTIIMTIILVVAAGLFWREIWGVFSGMSVLQAMEQIVTFVLHIAVATIAVYAVTTLPELIKPWMKTFRWRQRQARRGRSHMKPATKSSPRMPKLKAGQQPVVMIVKDEQKPIEIDWKG